MRRIMRASCTTSPVTYPAYPATDVGVRAADGSPMFGEIPEIPADLVQGARRLPTATRRRGAWRCCGSGWKLQSERRRTAPRQ